jgi:hypothetical protein
VAVGSWGSWLGRRQLLLVVVVVVVMVVGRLQSTAASAGVRMQSIKAFGY